MNANEDLRGFVHVRRGAQWRLIGSIAGYAFQTGLGLLGMIDN